MISGEGKWTYTWLLHRRKGKRNGRLFKELQALVMIVQKKESPRLNKFQKGSPKRIAVIGTFGIRPG